MLSFLASLGIGTIATKIAAAYEARQKAVTDTQKIQADERIKTLEARRDVMVAEAGSPINAVIRAGIAIGPMLYLLKIFVWDKVLGLGSTDALSSELWEVVKATLAFYFLYEAATTVARIAKR